MDDLIKRQDAIDACLNGFCACVSDCVDEIEKLPSAELNVPDINVGDMINRQDAIDILNKLDVSDGVGISSVACYLQEEAIRSIENLPSVQSERKTGKWIGTTTAECSECRSLYPAFMKFANYCPNCGAYTKGEEDGYLIRRLSELRSQYNCFDERERDAYHTLSEAIEALQQKTGKWQEVYAETDYRNGWIEFSCENCEYQHGLESGEYGWYYGEDIPWKYCPICGARMVGDTDDEI